MKLIQDYSRISSDNLGGIFEYMLRQGEEAEVFTFKEEWIDIGSFESYLSAHRSLSKHNQISESASVEDSELGSAVEIAKNCRIQNCRLDQVIVMEGCQLKNVRLRGCIIDKNCRLEDVDLDYKMIREGAVIKG